MPRWPVRVALFICVAFSLILAIRYARSCSEGPDPWQDFTIHPDSPLQDFADGKLGIVRPTFARSYLVVAYRYISGVPLTQDERDAVGALWLGRGADPIYRRIESTAEEHENPYVKKASDNAQGVDDWTAARAQVLGSSAERAEQLKPTGDYNSYLNCSNDAFATAAAVLEQRSKQFGKDSAVVKAWVSAQDNVFTNCHGTAEPVVPPSADPALPEILRFDREYQIAAAYMYSDRFDEASKRFQQIATEKTSPWHDIAPYLVARNMLRRATLDVVKPPANPSGYTPVPPFDPGKMQAAATYIHGLLAHPADVKFADDLQALSDRAEFRLHPDERRAELSQLLRKPAPKGQFYQWLWDYTLLLDARQDSSGEYGESAPGKGYSDLTPSREKDELTDWVLTFQAQQPEATDHALARWHAHPDSLPWLVCLLSKTKGTSAFAAEITTAAERIPSSAPAYVTAFYHRMRVHNERREFADSRREIDAFSAAKPDLPSVAREDILDLRLDAAANLEEVTRFSQRSSCLMNHQEDSPSCGKIIADHAALYLDALPLDLTMEVYRSSQMTDDARKQIADNLWMRAVLLNRHDVAVSLDPFVQEPSRYPYAIAPDVAKQYVQQYENASSAEDKRFAAVFLLLHQYAVGYNMKEAGAWCSAHPSADESAYYRPLPSILPPPPFLTESQLKQVQAERALLDDADSQAHFYVKTAIDFALGHPDDPRVPEALSRAVKNTRMNCNNQDTSALSEQAFKLLHKRYPGTSWAKNTKYWY